VNVSGETWPNDEGDSSGSAARAAILLRACARGMDDLVAADADRFSKTLMDMSDKLEAAGDEKVELVLSIVWLGKPVPEAPGCNYGH
jgi:hypothetical protein